MKGLTKILMVLGIASFLMSSSCNRDECDEIIPFIRYERFEQFQDSARLTFYFKDCDGDIGLNDNETEAPYDFNVFIDYYEMHDGVWTLVTPDPPFYYRIPIIEKQGKSDKLEGDLQVSLVPNYHGPNADTIRYEIVFKDRALHESNKIVTPAFVIP